MMDVPPSRAPEVELLLLSVARTAGRAEISEVVRAARGVTDWMHFKALADEHEVAPMVASGLREGGEDLIPSEVSSWLWDERRRIARRNLYLGTVLRSLLDSLDSHGVGCRVLKGLPLATQGLGDPALRVTADLDFLIRKTDLEEATEVFLDHGFFREEVLAPSAQKAKEDELYSTTFGRREGQVGLDVHWAFAPRKYGETRLLEEVWSEREEIPLFAGECPVLSWPHLPIHLAIHGSKHGPFPWPKLKWIADVAGLLVRRSDPEWREALSFGDEIGCRRRLLLAVAMADRCLDAPLSADLRRALDSEPEVLHVAAELESHLFSRPRSVPSAVGRLRIDATLRDGTAEQVAMVARSLLLPSKKEWGSVTLPKRLTWLYGPVRVGRLIWRYGLHPWRIRKIFTNRTVPDPD